ncbi:MAG: alpha/beta hydrolase [Myxococcota bacterium]
MTPPALDEASIRRHRFRGAEPDVEIAAIEWPGDGPPALLHHANGFCAAMWAPVAERLARHFRVFAVDARGHGDSSAPAREGAYAWAAMARDLGAVARAVRDLAGAPRIALGVGHSFGGTLTMTAASAEAGLYARAILIDPVILPRLTRAQRAAAAENPMAERARKRRHAWPSADEALGFFADKPLFADFTPRALRLYVEQALRADASGEVRLKCEGRVEGAIFAGSVDFDPLAVAARADLPLRVLRATRGDFTRAAYEELVATLPRGELGDIEGGHLVPMEQPERVADAILAFAGAPPG